MVVLYVWSALSEETPHLGEVYAALTGELLDGPPLVGLDELLELLERRGVPLDAVIHELLEHSSGVAAHHLTEQTHSLCRGTLHRQWWHSLWLLRELRLREQAH